MIFIICLLSRLDFTKFKPCIDEYIEAVSILKHYKFLTYDLKVKKIPMGGGFHSWHFENGSYHIVRESL